MFPSTRTSVDTVAFNDEKGVVVVRDEVSYVLELSPAERTRLLRKIDLHLLPLVSLLYFLSFL